MGNPLTCFKAYDLRGRLPDELNEDVAWRVGRAFAAELQPKTVVVGWDIRLSSPALAGALTRGLSEGGADVLELGLCGTEGVYFATKHLEADGGIMVTASHNPPDYNGMKLVREDSRPISGDTGLRAIQARAEAGTFAKSDRVGSIAPAPIGEPYVAHLLEYIDRAQMKPMHLVVNPGNGGAGLVVDALEPHLPLSFTRVHHEPDGTFPHGVPNPLLPENRSATSEAVRESGAQLGVAWDGDFDRCFFFDERGEFVEGYYIVGMLAEAFLATHPGATIVHDPRLTWNTIDIVRQAGGKPVCSKTGHAFIKERMRIEGAVYGGEMSAHHYFRDFAYCDSGMIPWLLVAELMARRGQPLSEILAERMAAYPVSGEINRRIEDPGAALEAVKARYQAEATTVDDIDGLSVEFSQWRFNLRRSNTEPLVRLNVESRGEPALMQDKTAELLAMLDARGAENP